MNHITVASPELSGKQLVRLQRSGDETLLGSSSACSSFPAPSPKFPEVGPRARSIQVRHTVLGYVFGRDHDSYYLEGRLREFCEERIPLQLNPKEIVVLNALPKNRAGKVLKSSLRI